jgi:mRNA interferase RelE/StbE
MEAFAANPDAFANLVTELKSLRARRIRIGDFRVLFEDTQAGIVVTDIGPRGSIHD